MHEYYDNYEEEDDGDDYSHPENEYKHHFKFDPAAWDAWGKWLYDALNDIVDGSENVWYAYGFPKKSIPVNDYFSNTASGYYPLLYLGNNQYNESIYKNKYSASESIDDMYKKHVQEHSVHFIKQPNYYFGLYDILN